MKLLETIVKANHDAARGSKQDSAQAVLDADALPVVALTCIDERLNDLLPDALGLENSDFVWLRTPGNVIKGPQSDIVAAIALACALKRGREIVVLGHTDCRVGKTSVLELTEGFRNAGVERRLLPNNLAEAFGLFASEHQNVANGVHALLASPLIGANLPIHGLLIDVNTGELRWVENGYLAADRGAAEAKRANESGHHQSAPGPATPDLGAGEPANWSMPDEPIGEFSFGPVSVDVDAIDDKIGAFSEKVLEAGREMVEQAGDKFGDRLADAFEQKFHEIGRFTVVGGDKNRYGPITGKKLLKWLAENRVTGKTLTRLEGSRQWQPLAAFLKKR